MSVNIQILDYSYGDTETNQIVLNGSFASSADWELGNGWSIAGGAASHASGSSGYLKQVNTFFQGQSYRIKYKISGRTTGSFVLANHLEGTANGFNQDENGAFVYDWVQGSSSTSKLRLWGSNSFDGDVEYCFVYNLSGIDREKSIIGELDISSHDDFPLALTFQISDIQKISSTSGDFSKTFKVPATSNNNKLLKQIYHPSVVLKNNPTRYKDCRIITDGLQTVTGLIVFFMEITWIGQKD